jgi:hypothetical protein
MKQMLPFDLAKAQFETNPEMQQAELGYKKAQTGLSQAQMQEAFQKVTINDMALMKQGMSDMITQGVQMGMRGATGKDVVSMIEAQLVQKMQDSKNPQERSMYENQVRQLRQDTGISEMISWTPEQVVSEGSKYLQQMHQLTPEYMLQQARLNAGLKEAGIRAASSSPKYMTADQSLVQAAQSLYPNDPAAQQKYISDRRLERAPAAMGTDKAKEYFVRGSDGKTYPLGATPAGVKEVGVPFSKEQMNKNAFEAAPTAAAKPASGRFKYVNGELVPQ